MLSRRGLLAGMAGAAALAGTAAFPTPASAAGLDYAKGVCLPAYAGRGLLFASDAVMRQQIDALVTARVGWLRTQMLAQQASPGAAGVYDWTPYDRVFSYANASGIQVLVTLEGQCAVDGPSPTQPRTAAARSRVAALAVAAVTHFGSRLNAIEVSNEANTTRFWLPRPSMAEYGPLLAAVYTAVKQASPTTPVLSAGTGGLGTSSYDITSIEWYRQLYAGGWQRYCDAIALHPYSGFTTTPGQNEEGYLKPLRALMNSYGDTAKPICGTETGVPTGGWYGSTQAVQAQILSNTWDYFRANAGNAGPLFYYTLYDLAAVGASSDAEDYYGLVTADGKAKTAFWTVRDLA